MLAPTLSLLHAAQSGGYAIGAFNVYNLEGALAVAAAAAAERSPALLQVHPAALAHGGPALLGLCLMAAETATAPLAVHLDHCTDPAAIRAALAAGVGSVMADGSHLDFGANVAFAAETAALAHAAGAAVEAELGRLAGTEDGLSLADYEARLTDPAQAAVFVARTGVDMLAVCIGNVHGPYARPPQFDFDRLQAIRQAVSTPLVLHGASGVPASLVQRCIELGVCKFNVNTELRQAYVAALRRELAANAAVDLLPLLQAGVTAMQEAAAAKMRLFGSSGRVGVA